MAIISTMEKKKENMSDCTKTEPEFYAKMFKRNLTIYSHL